MTKVPSMFKILKKLNDSYYLWLERTWSSGTLVLSAFLLAVCNSFLKGTLLTNNIDIQINSRFALGTFFHLKYFDAFLWWKNKCWSFKRSFKRLNNLKDCSKSSFLVIILSSFRSGDVDIYMGLLKFAKSWVINHKDMVADSWS